MSGYRLRQLLTLIAAVAAPFLTALALVPFRTDLSPANAALILVVAVVAVAAVGTRAAGVLAALSAAVGFDLLLTRPYGHFAITDGEDVRTAALLLIVGLIVSQLAVRVRRLEGAVIADESHLSRLEATSRLAEDGAPPEAVVEHVRRDLIDLLELRDCRFVYGSLIGRLPRLEHDGGLWLGLEPGDAEATYWPERWPDGETELRAVGGGHYYGRFLLDPFPGHPLPSRQARLVAVALAAQAGAALDTSGLAHPG
ncbi:MULTISPECIES: DUF4118 domain-containing protein [unclassified Streptomyces]|uniref:DUF4118 domain-containing protein n=1 Tax=unclassified Streptomyces TaxID=2593676 RepID=UPI002E2DF26A|nr:DUF4118 domain-containing protein [Streptomyces sp. NBC_00273]